MKKINLLLVLLLVLLSGCYLANGPPPSSTYWVKNGVRISYQEAYVCYKKSKAKSLDENELKRFTYLENKFKENPIDMINNHKDEYEDYYNLLDKISKLNSQCFYDLGYRFRPPLKWCLVQNGDSANICIENMKYRF
ncbi:hypothetical protein [Gallibacterium anatis]|uniref:Lipoprotein n=2 Tax=Gallibacterium anatis TaxID=750 RepID=A0A0A3A7D2_9PAST|nr:hypothetical protein [Gallibacterium anatis]KGQ42378.1 hypothetical protein JP29_12175 [Gallibacterium anatis]KGQ63005.1 hypothetical protein IO48_02730 [Gallibacterium anatis 4895]WAX71931.1 hypothetical protein CF557_02580 [Gallibacterium anatis]WIM84869.1 hypothetical protein QP020_02225 [Gallibacterium anatis]HJF73755.1 hypothetical protein [Gallibacterium anatis]